MPKPKLGKSRQGLPMHYSVGAIIEKDSKYLLIDRAKFPLGFACVAGHIDEGEDAETALKREVAEESGLIVRDFQLIAEEELDFNTCRRGVTVHYFYVFRCQAEGQIDRNVAETKSIGWYNIDEIKKLPLEPVWKYWFGKLGIIEGKIWASK